MRTSMLKSNSQWTRYRRRLKRKQIFLPGAAFAMTKSRHCSGYGGGTRRVAVIACRSCATWSFSSCSCCKANLSCKLGELSPLSSDLVSRTLNASRECLRGNDKMGKRVEKIEEEEGKNGSPDHIPPIRCSGAGQGAAAQW